MNTFAFPTLVADNLKELAPLVTREAMALAPQLGRRRRIAIDPVVGARDALLLDKGYHYMITF